MLKLTDITWLYHHLPMRFSLTVERGEQVAILYCGVHGLMREVPIEKVRECQDAFLDKLRTSAPEVIETLGSGKIDDATTQRIEQVMADIAGTYKA